MICKSQLKTHIQNSKTWKASSARPPPFERKDEDPQKTYDMAAVGPTMPSTSRHSNISRNPMGISDLTLQNGLSMCAKPQSIRPPSPVNKVHYSGAPTARAERNY